ncbi:hypothetical protein ASF62_10900 [Leifsonia sp. Leaf325]|nr:metallophosphoesterase [Leifsonia sp. Leaf325]KQQ94569.1 hypothetical protein ASF62_10900 [Leifsonia sp. Leaf325]
MSNPNPLPSAHQIGILGDAHGNLGDVLDAARALEMRGIQAIVQLGDLGIPHPGEGWARPLDRLNSRLEKAGQTIYFVDGHHEWFDKLYEFPIGDDNLRWLRPHIAHLPRGYRGRLASGHSFATLGGAGSIDYFTRTEGETVWSEEVITDEDLDWLGFEPVDVLFGHDAPTWTPGLTDLTKVRYEGESDEAISYVERARQIFTTGFLQVAPKLYIGSHFQHHVDQVAGFWGESSFACRVVLLDQLPNHETETVAILDTDTLHLTFATTKGMDRPTGARQITNLATQAAGQWRVHTLTSQHVFDFDAGTVTRLPQFRTVPVAERQPMSLGTIEDATIGRPGRWTVKIADPRRLSMRCFASVITYIEPVEPASAGA